MTSEPQAARMRISRLPEPERGDVGEGELAEIAQLLGDQERDDRPADQPAHRVDQAVIAGSVNQARNAQERGRRHVVAGDREAVLETGDAAAGRVEIRGRRGLLRRPVCDAERKRDKGDEHADGDPVDRLLGAAVDGAGRKRERGQAGSNMAASEYAGELSHGALPSTISTDQGVIFGIGLADIDGGEHERRDDDEQTDRNADGHYARPQRRAEEFGRVRDQQDEAEVDDEHDQRQRPAERRAPPHQLLVVGIPLDRFVASRIHACFSRRIRRQTYRQRARARRLAATRQRSVARPSLGDTTESERNMQLVLAALR